MKTFNPYNKAKKEAVDIHEKFIPYRTKPIDSKYRITLGGKLIKLLGKRMKFESCQIFVGKNGDILLRPAMSVPSSEVWIYHNPEVIGNVHKGFKEAHEGKTEKVDNLDSFLESL